MTTAPPRVVIAGAGIAGSLITAGLAERRDIEVICLERVEDAGHADAGTGLNIGPNAITALRSVMPEQADALMAHSLPWRRWTIGLTDGTPLLDLALETVADDCGCRIRWSELYALLREPIARHIVYGAELSACGQGPNGLFVQYADPRTGQVETLDGIDLLIAGDGRYSRIRDHFFGKEEPTFFGIGLYRILFPVGDDCPIDDYGQWFNGPNRLLAFRVPGDLVYCAGSFPLPADGVIRDDMKTAEALRRHHTPTAAPASPACRYLIEAIVDNVDRLHWARLQEGSIRYAGPPGVLLVGDAAHPMVPTLGQGATQAVEDACVVVDQIRHRLDGGGRLDALPDTVDRLRRDRMQFVVDFSREATDTMLAGSDPIAGTLAKLQPPFQDALKRLYRDVPRATAPAPRTSRTAA